MNEKESNLKFKNDHPEHPIESAIDHIFQTNWNRDKQMFCFFCLFFVGGGQKKHWKEKEGRV